MDLCDCATKSLPHAIGKVSSRILVACRLRGSVWRVVERWVSECMSIEMHNADVFCSCNLCGWDTPMSRVLWGRIFHPNMHVAKGYDIRSDCTASDIFDEHLGHRLRSRDVSTNFMRRSRSEPPACDRIHKMLDTMQRRLTNGEYYDWVARQQDLAMDAEGITGERRRWHGLV